MCNRPTLFVTFQCFGGGTRQVGRSARGRVDAAGERPDGSGTAQADADLLQGREEVEKHGVDGLFRHGLAAREAEMGGKFLQQLQRQGLGIGAAGRVELVGHEERRLEDGAGPSVDVEGAAREPADDPVPANRWSCVSGAARGAATRGYLQG